MRLNEAWEREAERWIAWARAPGHDSYWRFHRDQFLELVPPPGRLTVDVGCGEGRLSRDLAALGHRVVAVDASPTLVEAARAAAPELDVRVADAAALPLGDACADLVVAFMSLQDVDDMPGAVGEAARVLVDGGAFCVAIVHPLNSAGAWETEDESSPLLVQDYFEPRISSETFERDGLAITFHTWHRPLEAYMRALEDAGFLTEAVREHPLPEGGYEHAAGRRWRRIPLFMHLRALKAG